MAKDRGTSPLFILVAVVTTIAALYFAKAILLPIALAILLSFLLAPLADRLESWRVPRIPAVLLVVGMSFALIGGIGWVVGRQLYDLSRELPKHKATIIAKIEAVRPTSPAFTRFMDTLTELRNTITGEMGVTPAGEQSSTTTEQGTSNQSAAKTDATPTGQASNVGEAAAVDGKITSRTYQTTDHLAGRDFEVQVITQPPSRLSQVPGWLATLIAPLATSGMVIILVLFLLLDRENQRTRIVQLFGRSHLHATTEAMHDVTKRVGRYLRLLFLVNSTYGLAVATGLWFIGVPGAIMWGVLGFSLRFVPYLGPILAAAVPILVSVATSTGWTQPLMALSWFVFIELISNNIVEPLVYGNTMGISTVGVVISAIFWTWLWGPIGLILAMPMTVCLVVVARYVPQLRFITVLLADNPPLSPGEHVYQRLLASDYQEPLKLARKVIKESSLVAYYDEVLIPALVMAEQDRHADLLSDEQATSLQEAVEDLVAELGEGAVAARFADKDKIAAQAAADALASIPTAEILSARVLCVPLRDEADELASRMLAQLLIAEGYPVLTAGAELLTSEVVDRVAATDADIVVISVLPPIAQRDSRLLWKRLRLHYPNLPIIVGIWSGTGAKAELPTPVGGKETGDTVTSLSEAMALIRSTAAQLRLEAKAV
jgi:predicted PurR-regulated permease PerM